MSERGAKRPPSGRQIVSVVALAVVAVAIYAGEVIAFYQDASNLDLAGSTYRLQALAFRILPTLTVPLGGVAAGAVAWWWKRNAVKAIQCGLAAAVVVGCIFALRVVGGAFSFP